MSRSLRSIATALVLLVALSAGTAHALPLPGRTAPSQPAGLFTAAWEWLTGLFGVDPAGAQGTTAVSRDKAGWEMDPNGLPAPIASPTRTSSPARETGVQQTNPYI